MPVRELIAEVERRKNEGNFDNQIFGEINLTVKMTDKEIDAIDLESTRERARKVFNVTLLGHLKARYPHLFVA